MAPLNDAEKDALISKVSQKLSETPYACSSLTQLTNGTTNFVFRGELAQPIPADDVSRKFTTVIIKYSTEYAAVNKDFPIDVSRAVYEESVLHALDSLPANATVVKAPRLYLFIHDANIQVLEDFLSTVDLKNAFVSPTANNVLTDALAASIGRDMGTWLRSFHDWASSPNAELRALGDNEPMRKLKYSITYESFLTVLGNSFPELLNGHRLILEQVKDAATKDFTKKSNEGNQGKDWGIIHGDFWSGNVLLPSDPLLEGQLPGSTKFFIVDWEFAQFGHRAYDIGQMIGDIYERHHFQKADGAIPAIKGFIQGYGELDEELAFRITIHAGVQLIGFYTRRAPDAPLKFPLEQVTDAMRIGRDWILNGWQKNRDYFDNGPLATLFKNR